MPRRAPASVFDLPRNDVEACRIYWLTHEITGEEWRTMLAMQDNPAKLIAASKRWRRTTGRSRPRARG